MVIDCSAILSIYFNEPAGSRITEILEHSPTPLRMSTVTLTETLILLQDRQAKGFDPLKKQLINSSILFIPPTVRQSEIAAEARFKFPLNLGDCFVYALAKEDRCPIVTLDSAFRKTDADIVLI